jgi:hypothetical protein
MRITEGSWPAQARERSPRVSNLETREINMMAVVLLLKGMREQSFSLSQLHNPELLKRDVSTNLLKHRESALNTVHGS